MFRSSLRRAVMPLALAIVPFLSTAAMSACPPTAPADTNGDGAVDGTGLVNVILARGTSGLGVAGIDADVDDDGVVGGSDLVALVLAWGPA